MRELAAGTWLSRDRVQRIAGICLVISIATLMWLFATSHGTLDWRGRPLGTDFSQVWAAGEMVWRGQAAQVWDWPTHFRVQQELHHSRTVDIYGWHYPPPFLLIAALLATVPYVPALIVWQLATLIPFTMLMQRIVPGRETVLLTLAAPVTLICLTHGHNGFLTALLLGGGLLLLDRRPFYAGLLFGCLIYKPQFALIIPVLLIAGRNWRAIAGAALSSALLVGVTLALWGWPVWQAFLDSLPLTKHVVIEQGATGWQKIMSPFAAMRSWGASIAAAYVVQSFVTVASIAVVAWVSSGRARPNLRNSIVCAAVVLSTPYVLDYDFVVLLPALAWLWKDRVEHGELPWEATLAGFAWISPLFGRQVAEFTLIPVGLLSVVIIALLALRRVRASPFRRSREAFAQ